MLLRIFISLSLFAIAVYPLEIVEVQYSREVEGGELEECSFMYKEFPGTYLRGVRENSYNIWYNDTSLDSCKQICCFAEDDCLSFSYFNALKICFIMNVTKEHESAELKTVGSWRHFQKWYGYDTTASYDYETTPQPTTPFRISPGFIPGNKKPEKYVEKPPQGASMPNTSSNPKSNPSIQPQFTDPTSKPKPNVPISLSTLTSGPKSSTIRVKSDPIPPPTPRGNSLKTSKPIDDSTNSIIDPETEDLIVVNNQQKTTQTETTYTSTSIEQERPTTPEQYPDESTTSFVIFDPYDPDQTTPDPSYSPHANTGDYDIIEENTSTTASFLTASANGDTKPPSSHTTQHVSSSSAEAPEKIQDPGAFHDAKSEPFLGGDAGEPEGSGIYTEGPRRPDNTQICPLKCENGGRCERVLVNHAQHAVVPYRCLCVEGFYGSNCELQMEKYTENGPADYVIALVCLAIIIVILFVAVLIAFYFNRHKTGKYRVRKEKERWNRKRKMRGNQNFIPSPMGSLAASEGSVRSGSDRSTATLV